MAKNVKIADIEYNNVPYVNLPLTEGGKARFYDCVGTKAITENGTVTVTGYESVSVNVPTGGAGDFNVYSVNNGDGTQTLVIVSGGGSGGGEVDPPITGNGLLFSSTEADGTPYNGGQGYKSGWYFEKSESTGRIRESARDSIAMSGYMPVTYGQTITFENIGTYASDSTFDDAYYCQIALFDSNKNLIECHAIADWFYSDNATTRDSLKRMTSITLIEGLDGDGVISNVAYFRVGFAASEVSENSVISTSGGASSGGGGQETDPETPVTPPAENPTTMEKVMLYYGYPSEFPVSTYTAHDIVVLGDEYEMSEHEDHANAVSLISQINATSNTRVVGYVPIGMDPDWDDSCLEMSEIKSRIDKWKAMGAKGIFLDEFGYDYYITRERQNEAVGYCHDNGLFVIANAWTVDHCFSTENLYLDWINHYGNPNHLPTLLGPNDYYIFENLYYDSTGRNVKYASMEHLMQAMTYKQLYKDVYGTKSISLDSIKSTASDTQFKQYASVSLIADAMFGIDAVALGDENWGSMGNYHTWTFPSTGLLPASGNLSTLTKTASGTTFPYHFERTLNGNTFALDYAVSNATSQTVNATITMNGQTITNLWDV